MSTGGRSTDSLAVERRWVLTVIQQFLDKACGAPGIVRPDVVSNSDEIALRRSRDDDFHIGAQAFPAAR
jgi:hypothetical protein